MFCVLFAIGFIAGGAASAANAANVQSDYDDSLCEDIQDDLPSDHPLVEICDDVEKLIRAQSNAAVSTFTYYSYCIR